MMKSGRVMYGWPQDDGGIPPKLENIKTYQTDQGKIRKFVNELLGKHTELGRDMKNLLVANGMRFFDDYIKLMLDEPSHMYSNLHDLLEKDVFVNKVSEGFEFRN